jgi:hypothetical protein
MAESDRPAGETGAIVGRCPSCDGCGGFVEDNMTLYGIPGGHDWSEKCGTCDGTGVVTLLPPLTDEEREPGALRERAVRLLGSDSTALFGETAGPKKGPLNPLWFGYALGVILLALAAIQPLAALWWWAVFGMSKPVGVAHTFTPFFLFGIGSGLVMVCAAPGSPRQSGSRGSQDAR